MKEKMDKIVASVLGVKSKIDCLVYLENMREGIEALRAENIRVTNTFPFIKAVGVSLDSGQICTLAKHKCVQFISSQSNVFAMMNISRQILGVDSVKLDGKGITIAYIDTGISPSLDFCLGKKRILKFIDLINFKVFPYDDNGHGTFVAGVGSGNGLISNGKYSGIAKKSNIISIKALAENGEANASHILEAMQWVYDNKQKYNIRVVCMSFGSEPLGENDPIMRGADELWKSGIVVVAAAGNSGPEFETIKSPGISRNIITVGGFDDNRISDTTYNEAFFEIAEFSSRGPALEGFKPDFVAPAVDITSCGVGEFYTKLSGTSVATPMIAGISALLLEKDSNLTPNDIKAKLKTLGRPITFNRNKEGDGYVVLTRSDVE